MQDDETENVKQALRLLSKSSDEFDLLFVARHKLTPIDAAIDLYERSEDPAYLQGPFIRHHIALRLDLPIDFLVQKLSTDPEWILGHLWNSNQIARIPEDLILQHLRISDGDAYVRDHTPPRVVDAIVSFHWGEPLQCSFNHLHEAAVHSKSPEALRRLATHKHWAIRYEVAKNRNTPDDVWMGMHKDRSKNVRDVVQERASRVDVLDVLG